MTIFIFEGVSLDRFGGLGSWEGEKVLVLDQVVLAGVSPFWGFDSSVDSQGALLALVLYCGQLGPGVNRFGVTCYTFGYARGAGRERKTSGKGAGRIIYEFLAGDMGGGIPVNDNDTGVVKQVTGTSEGLLNCI